VAAEDVQLQPDDSDYDEDDEDGAFPECGLGMMILSNENHLKPHGCFTADAPKNLTLAGMNRDEAESRLLLAVENHKFKDGRPVRPHDADDGAQVGPVVFLSGGAILYAVADDGSPGRLWYMQEAALLYGINGAVDPAVPEC